MSDKYLKLEINLLPFLELNKIDINENSNTLYKKIIKSKIPIDTLREIVYFY